MNRRRDYNFELENSSDEDIYEDEENNVPATNFELETEKGREKKIIGGYGFTFEKFNCDRTVEFWRCEKRASDKCKVRIHILRETSELHKQMNEHSHGADPARIEVQKVKRNIHKRARETNEVHT